MTNEEAFFDRHPVITATVAFTIPRTFGLIGQSNRNSNRGQRGARRACRGTTTRSRVYTGLARNTPGARDRLTRPLER
jgi:hypothetical protein